MAKRKKHTKRPSKRLISWAPNKILDEDTGKWRSPTQAEKNMMFITSTNPSKKK